MNLKYISPLVFILICIIVNFIIHKYVRNFILAVIYSATITTVLFQVIGFFVLGYLDPFFIIALPIGWIIAFFISLIIGMFIFVIRQSKK